MPSQPVVTRSESPAQPDVQALLVDLDRYLASLYPPEANHILDLPALLADDVRFFVAREDGRAVGTAAARVVDRADAAGGEHYGEVKRMWVDPAQRGRGIASRLLAAVEAALRSEGVPLARLETGRDQREAVRLYEGCGYVRRPPFGGYSDNGLSLFYEKALI